MKLNDGELPIIHFDIELSNFIQGAQEAVLNYMQKLNPERVKLDKIHYIKLLEYIVSLISDPYILVGFTTVEKEISIIKEIDTDELIEQFWILYNNEITDIDELQKFIHENYGDSQLIPLTTLLAFLFLELYFKATEVLIDEIELKTMLLAYIDTYEGKDSGRVVNDAIVIDFQETDQTEIGEIRKHFFEATKSYFTEHYISDITIRAERIKDANKREAFIANHLTQLDNLKYKDQRTPFSQYLRHEYDEEEDIKLFSNAHRYWEIIIGSRMEDHIANDYFFDLHRLGITAGLFEAVEKLKKNSNALRKKVASLEMWESGTDAFNTRIQKAHSIFYDRGLINAHFEGFKKLFTKSDSYIEKVVWFGSFLELQYFLKGISKELVIEKRFYNRAAELFKMNTIYGPVDIDNSDSIRHATGEPRKENLPALDGVIEIMNRHRQK